MYPAAELPRCSYTCLIHFAAPYFLIAHVFWCPFSYVLPIAPPLSNVLKELSHPIFLAFLWPTISNLYFLCGRWRFLNFSYSTYFNIWRYNFNVYRTKQCIISRMFTKAACNKLLRFPLAVCAWQSGSLSRLCMTSGFPLAACDAQAGSL